MTAALVALFEERTQKTYRLPTSKGGQTRRSVLGAAAPEEKEGDQLPRVFPGMSDLFVRWEGEAGRGADQAAVPLPPSHRLDESQPAIPSTPATKWAPSGHRWGPGLSGLLSSVGPWGMGKTRKELGHNAASGTKGAGRVCSGAQFEPVSPVWLRVT